MRIVIVLLVLASLVGCKGNKEVEEIHFGPGPGDTEDDINKEYSN